MTDAALILRARGGDHAAFSALLDRHKGLVRLKTSDYYAPGMGAEDLHQEALFGFFKAVRDYQPSQSSFRNFAALCIERQVITAVKTATREKHGPLNESVSLAKPVGEEDGDTLEERLVAGGPSLEDRIAIRQEVTDLGDSMRERLSERECAVLVRYADGYEYEEIAGQLGITYKSVDTALTRARWKLRGSGPACRPEAGDLRPAGDLGYSCPSCGGPTRKVHRRGRPPKCVVCRVTAPGFRLKNAKAAA